MGPATREPTRRDYSSFRRLLPIAPGLHEPLQGGNWGEQTGASPPLMHARPLSAIQHHLQQPGRCPAAPQSEDRRVNHAPPPFSSKSDQAALSAAPTEGVLHAFIPAAPGWPVFLGPRTLCTPPQRNIVAQYPHHGPTHTGATRHTQFRGNPNITHPARLEKRV